MGGGGGGLQEITFYQCFNFKNLLIFDKFTSHYLPSDSKV